MNKPRRHVTTTSDSGLPYGSTDVPDLDTATSTNKVPTPVWIADEIEKHWPMLGFRAELIDWLRQTHQVSPGYRPMNGESFITSLDGTRWTNTGTIVPLPVQRFFIELMSGHVLYQEDTGRSPLGSIERGVPGGWWRTAFPGGRIQLPAPIGLKAFGVVTKEYAIAKKDECAGIDEFGQHVCRVWGLAPVRGVLVVNTDSRIGYRCVQDGVLDARWEIVKDPSPDERWTTTIETGLTADQTGRLLDLVRQILRDAVRDAGSFTNLLLACAAPAMRSHPEQLYLWLSIGGEGKTTTFSGIVRYFGGRTDPDHRLLSQIGNLSQENLNLLLGSAPAVLFDEFRFDDPRAWERSIGQLRKLLTGISAGAARQQGHDSVEVRPRAVLYGTSNKDIPTDGTDADERRVARIIGSGDRTTLARMMRIVQLFDMWPMVLAGAIEWVRVQGRHELVQGFVIPDELSARQRDAVLDAYRDGYADSRSKYRSMSTTEWREIGLVTGSVRPYQYDANGEKVTNPRTGNPVRLDTATMRVIPHPTPKDRHEVDIARWNAVVAAFRAAGLLDGPAPERSAQAHTITPTPVPSPASDAITGWLDAIGYPDATTEKRI